MLDLIIGVLIALLITAVFTLDCAGIIPSGIAGGVAGLGVVAYGFFVRVWTVKMMVRRF